MIEKIEIPLDKINTFLKSLPNYVFLRNTNYVDNLNKGGDIDLWVENTREAESILFKTVGKPVLSIKRSYVWSYYYEWGSLDITDDIQWHGCSFISSEDIEDNIVDLDGIKKLSIAAEAVICWFSSLIYGGFYKVRYNTVIQKAVLEEKENFTKLLNHIVGNSLSTNLLNLALLDKASDSVKIIRKIKFILFFKSFAKNPFKTIWEFCKHYIVELKLRLNPPYPWFAFVGVDGSGKSSVIAELSEKFPSSLARLKIEHWRPFILDSHKKHGKPVTNPHDQIPHNKLRSILKLFYIYFDWLLGYYLNIINFRAKKDIVIYDRFYMDLCVDSIRYRYQGGKILAEFLFLFLPKPTKTFLLISDPEGIWKRKSEIIPSKIVELQEKYLATFEKKKNTVIVDTKVPLTESVDIVFKEILSAFHDLSR